MQQSIHKKRIIDGRLSLDRWPATPYCIGMEAVMNKRTMFQIADDISAIEASLDYTRAQKDRMIDALRSSLRSMQVQESTGPRR